MIDYKMDKCACLFARAQILVGILFEKNQPKRSTSTSLYVWILFFDQTFEYFLQRSFFSIPFVLSYVNRNFTNKFIFKIKYGHENLLHVRENVCALIFIKIPVNLLTRLEVFRRLIEDYLRTCYSKFSEKSRL
jgi:hypothetical protein